jgi:hypothetical protein
VFGSHGRLERKLREHGKAALAAVLSARVRVPGVTLTTRINLGPRRQETGPILWKMTVRVEPDGEPAFDAKISAWLKDEGYERSVVPVLYDPFDHRKVMFDRSVEARNAARQAEYAMRDRWVEENRPANPGDLLKQLIDLHDRGKVTDAEFEAYKQKLFGQ